MPPAPIVHVAGTKGKGSVTSMIASILTAQGYRVGLYTSPHLQRLAERFRVNGEPASDAQMTGLIDRIRPVVDAMESDDAGRPSFFELTTAMAVDHFHRESCDVWVLETGLGGRLDSTNVFQSHVTAVTTIGLDHQHVLGDTLEDIAGEKAGIFKPGVPAINGITANPARDVIQAAAKRCGAPLIQAGVDFEVTDFRPAPGWGGILRCRGLEPWVAADADVRISLEGHHQATNAAIAVAAVSQLNLPVEPDSIVRGLAAASLPARLERFARQSDDHVVLVDAAHNIDSITALANVLHTRFREHQVGIVFGTSMDKDAETMLRLLADHADAFWLTRYHGNPRYVSVETLETLWRDGIGQGRSQAVVAESDPGKAFVDATQWMDDAGDRRRVVVVCGSFFLAAELRPMIVDAFTNTADEP